MWADIARSRLMPGEQWFSAPGNSLPVFDVRGVPTGIMICRDKSFPEVAAMLALEGAQLLLAPHATTELASINSGHGR